MQEARGLKRRAGILAPLFSLYSKNSVGIGEFDDIKLLVDWCQKTGLSIIQLLPMNETGPISCPYDSSSSFALEPSYISLRDIPRQNKTEIEDKINYLKKAFPAGSQYVNYGFKQKKIDICWDIFSASKDLLSEDLRQFKKENSYWLLDFALFQTLKKIYEGKPWYDWPQGLKNRDPEELEDFRGKHEREIDFEIWLQWQLFEQFTKTRQYANSQGVLIKGDLPILVCRDSSDVWQHPEYFKLEFAAGAPRDMYCAKGQRWGMPTYNWENISSYGYKYLKEKLKYAQNFYDALRIDHVVGLFRIWSIDFNEHPDNQGLYGHFDPADESLWRDRGRRLLEEMTEDTDMFLCAEDLGIIPKACTDTLKEMAIPGNDVQRWVKDWDVKHDFLDPRDYRALSVAMLSTHDTTNWPAWWENEAGTVDEALLVKKCVEGGIDYEKLKDKLFNFSMSKHGRLRWLNSVNSSEILAQILGKNKEEIQDFIHLYENSYQEKEKLWKHFGFKAKMRQKCDKEIIKAALKTTLDSASVFSIELIIDWLMPAGVFKGDPYQYRINTPGTVNPRNWSLTIPISLEDLLKHKFNQEIKEMVIAAGRNV